MKIVVLDGYGANPGDLSWERLREIGELAVYDRTAAEDTVGRAAAADIVPKNVGQGAVSRVYVREMMGIVLRN